ncbi:MAG: hypothetical protein DRJ51_09550 [Thermoprotei archaeon]|nr:MAG: hypothetical protein DRJ51_09550 [Thermoprotei archaeon]
MFRRKRLKLVIYGEHGVGKTTLLEKILGNQILKIDDGKSGSTIAMDYGCMFINGFEVHCFGTPGQNRFEFMREVLSKGVNLALIVIDSTKGISQRDIQTIKELKQSKIPVIVVANKQDLPGALTPSEISSKISECTGTCPVIGTSAKYNVGIDRLLLEVYRLIDPLYKAL